MKFTRTMELNVAKQAYLTLRVQDFCTGSQFRKVWRVPFAELLELRIGCLKNNETKTMKAKHETSP